MQSLSHKSHYLRIFSYRDVSLATITKQKIPALNDFQELENAAMLTSIVSQTQIWAQIISTKAMSTTKSHTVVDHVLV